MQPLQSWRLQLREERQLCMHVLDTDKASLLVLKIPSHRSRGAFMQHVGEADAGVPGLDSVVTVQALEVGREAAAASSFQAR